MDSPEERAKRFDLHAEVKPETIWDVLTVTQKEDLADVGITYFSSLEAITAAARVTEYLIIDSESNTIGGPTGHSKTLSEALNQFAEGRAEDEAFDHSIIKDDPPAHIGPIGIALDDIGSEGR